MAVIARASPPERQSRYWGWILLSLAPQQLSTVLLGTEQCTQCLLWRFSFSSPSCPSGWCHCPAVPWGYCPSYLLDTVPYRKQLSRCCSWRCWGEPFPAERQSSQSPAAPRALQQAQVELWHSPNRTHSLSSRGCPGGDAEVLPSWLILQEQGEL